MTLSIGGLHHDPYDGTYGHLVYHGPYDAFIHDRQLLSGYLHEQWYAWFIPRLQEQLAFIVSDPELTVLYNPEPVLGYTRLYTAEERLSDMTQWTHELQYDIDREFGSQTWNQLNWDNLYEAWAEHITRYMADFVFDSEYTPARRLYVCQEACLPGALQTFTPEQWTYWHEVIHDNIQHSPMLC